jgi:hypothetical protein
MEVVGCVLRSLHHARGCVYAQRGLNAEKLLAILIQSNLPECLRKIQFCHIATMLMPLDKAANTVSMFGTAEYMGTQHELTVRQYTVMRYFPELGLLTAYAGLAMVASGLLIRAPIFSRF